MKKFLSTMLAAAMLLSLVIVASVPVAAADGMWTTYGTASNYALPENERVDVPGYEYTDEGVSMVPAEWNDQMPFGTIQTKEPWNIQDGIYMEVVIDAYSYEASDKWVNINLWSQQMTQPGSSDMATYGYGLQTLFRPGPSSEAGKYSLTVSRYDNWVYYKEGFTQVPYAEHEADRSVKYEAIQDENGNIKLVFELTYDGENYSFKVCGIDAPADACAYLKEAFPDGQAYVGITMQNNKKNGTVGCTITKFGPNIDEATIPQGDDSRSPISYSDTAAEEVPIASPDTVEIGKPAIILTGDLVNSATGKAPISTVGSTVTVNDDFTVHVVETKQSGAAVTFNVKKDVAYAIDDFPVAIVLTKNYCACENPEACYATESVDCYALNGEFGAAGSDCRIFELEMCYDPIVIEEGDKAGSYLYFYTNMVEDGGEGQTGRINGVQYLFQNIKYTEAGRNAFDIEFVAYFRTVEEAEDYVYEYLGVDRDAETETETVTDEITTEEPDVDVTTEEPDVDITTEEPDVDITTEKPAGNVTTEEEPKGGDDKPAKSGCGSVVGTSVVAIVAVVGACGFVSFKKKKD